MVSTNVLAGDDVIVTPQETPQDGQHAERQQPDAPDQVPSTLLDVEMEPNQVPSTLLDVEMEHDSQWIETLAVTAPEPPFHLPDSAAHESQWEDTQVVGAPKPVVQAPHEETQAVVTEESVNPEQPVVESQRDHSQMIASTPSDYVDTMVEHKEDQALEQHQAGEQLDAHTHPKSDAGAWVIVDDSESEEGTTLPNDPALQQAPNKPTDRNIVLVGGEAIFRAVAEHRSPLRPRTLTYDAPKDPKADANTTGEEQAMIPATVPVQDKVSLFMHMTAVCVSI